MTISFYTTPGTLPDAAERFACQLVREAYDAGNSVWLVCRDDAHAAQLDKLLWTFSQECFLPHVIYPFADPAMGETILQTLPAALIATSAENPFDFPQLINLSEQCLDTKTDLIELVPPDPDGKQRARERFVRYREKGFAPKFIETL